MNPAVSDLNLVTKHALGGKSLMTRLRYCAYLILIFLSAPFVLAQHAFLWSSDGSMTDLGSLKGGQSYGAAINASGEVVGSAFLPTAKASGLFHAFAWTPSGGMTDIGVLRGLFAGQSGASAINDLGIIVGSSYTGQAHYAVLWQLNRHVVNLGSLSVQTDFPYSAAFGINRAGQVVGASQVDSGQLHAFLWSSASGMKDLGTLPSGSSSDAQGINNRGEVVGWADSTAGIFGFSWTETGGMVSLGWCPGSAYSDAYAVNHVGEIVGYCEFPDGSTHSFLWTAQRGMVDLGTLGGTSSQALGINNHGVVVGMSQIVGDGATHAFSWTQPAGMVDLGVPSGYSTCSASGINDSGQIVGYCQ